MRNANQKCEEKIINLKDLFEVTEEEVLNPDFCGVPEKLMELHTTCVSDRRELFREIIKLETSIKEIKWNHKKNYIA